MTTDIFDGDPLIEQTQDGAEMHIRGGQQLMDTGFENQVNFAQLTWDDHWSEDFQPDANKRFTGLLLKASKKPITRQTLIETARAAEADAANPAFGKIQSEATNPISQDVLVETHYEPISGDPKILRLTKNGQNWANQFDGTASDKI